MDAKQLLRDGKVRDAIQALGATLRARPDDTSARTFLFELLCFSGEWDRASRQLDLLCDASREAELGSILYRSALHAERARHHYAEVDGEPEEAPPVGGALNGRAIHSISDADPAVGGKLEVLVAGSYRQLAFHHIRSLRMEAPRRLRDTLWVPAVIETSPALGEGSLGEALLPTLYPFSWKHPRESVWLGRETVWAHDELGRERPQGQRVLLVDGEEVPFLEIRELRVTAAARSVAHE
jgi:type VI secretion system protein ImpE